jgi:hypothetical protein
MIQIIDHTQENNSHYFELATEKKSAFIAFTPNYINVICCNAAHKAYQGAGKCFHHGWDEALNAYKSADMKSMIECARNLSQKAIN